MGKRRLRVTNKEIRMAAQSCKTRGEFQDRFPSEYNLACQRKILQKVSAHLPYQRRRAITRFKDVFRAAKKFKYRKDFQLYARNAYDAARRMDILEEVCSHMQPKGSQFIRQIYVFEHSDKSVYIGLTSNAKIRYQQHMRPDSKQKVSLLLQAKQKQIIQTFKVLPRLYTALEASLKEIELVNQYRKRGWTILNTARPGGTGGGTRKYTLAKCVECALKCKTRVEMARKFHSAYRATIRNNWQDHVFSKLRPSITEKYSDEELFATAKKYQTRSKFRKHCPNEFKAAWVRGILKDICLHMKYSKRLLVTDDEIFRVASQCETKKDFYKNHPKEYTIAARRKILQFAYKHLKPKIKRAV